MTATQMTQRHCVSCGREIDWNALFCPYCGHDFRSPSPHVALPQHGKNRSTMIAVVVVIVLVALVAVVVGAFVLAPKADLRADLSYYASNDDTMYGGTIVVYGTVYNYGDKMGDGTMNFHIYDGFQWHNYSAPTGVVPANGSVDFDWSTHFDLMDENYVQVEYTLTTR